MADKKVRCASIKRLGTPERCQLTDGHNGQHEAAGQHWVGTRRTCPDDGYCHHGCATGCFRVVHAGPLSGVFPDDTWPDEVVQSHGSPRGWVF